MSSTHHTGRHLGVNYARIPLRDLLPHTNSTRPVWCPRYVNGQFTGDHFETLAQLKTRIERDNPTDDRAPQFRRDD